MPKKSRPPVSPAPSVIHCSCGRGRCNAPQMYQRLLEIDDGRALLEVEVSHLQRRMQFLDQIKADRESHLWSWQQQQQEYQAQMYHAWLVSPQRRWQPVKVDLPPIWRREIADWYHQERAEISHLLQGKQQALRDTEDLLYQRQQALSQLDVKCSCSPQIAKMARSHLLRLREQQDRSLEHMALLGKQQEELNRAYDALQKRFEQQPPLPHQTGKRAVNTRWWLYAIFGIGRPTSRSAQVSLLDQEDLTERFQQECERHSGFLWYSSRYWQLGKALIQEYPAVLSQRYQLAETFLQSHLARKGMPHP